MYNSQCLYNASWKWTILLYEESISGAVGECNSLELVLMHGFLKVGPIVSWGHIWYSSNVQDQYSYDHGLLGLKPCHGHECCCLGHACCCLEKDGVPELFLSTRMKYTKCLQRGSKKQRGQRSWKEIYVLFGGYRLLNSHPRVSVNQTMKTCTSLLKLDV